MIEVAAGDGLLDLQGRQETTNIAVLVCMPDSILVEPSTLRGRSSEEDCRAHERQPAGEHKPRSTALVRERKRSLEVRHSFALSLTDELEAALAEAVALNIGSV